MLSRYFFTLVLFFVVNIVHSRILREEFVLNKVPVKIEKPYKISTIEPGNEIDQNKLKNDDNKQFIADADSNKLDDDDEKPKKLNGDEKQSSALTDINVNPEVEDDIGGDMENAGKDGNEDENKMLDLADNSGNGKQDAENDGENKVLSQADEDDIKGNGTQDADDRQIHKLKQIDYAFKNYHLEKINYMQNNVAGKWPLGIIPYNLDTSSSDNILAARVRDAMDILEIASCVQFRALAGKVPQNYSWVHITNPERRRECSHKPKRKASGEIVLILGFDCLKRREILHALMHAIGFNDEVSHPQRDQYVRIAWENIQPQYYRLFSLKQNKVLTEYDPMSIMHFHDRAFSKNGKATIVLLASGLQIQPSDTLSQLDKMKLALTFGHECNRRTVDNFLDTCKTVMHKDNKFKFDGKAKLRRPCSGGAGGSSITNNINIVNNNNYMYSYYPNYYSWEYAGGY